MVIMWRNIVCEYHIIKMHDVVRFIKEVKLKFLTFTS